MKQQILSLVLLFIHIGLFAQVGINNPTPHASSALDVSSTTRGFLPPRMTLAQRNAIASPAEGLLISCTNCPVKGLHQYVNGAWQALTTSSTTTTAGNYGTVVNPITGKVWLDRNLGASRVPNSSADAEGFGDLYQWGRAADGHQLRTSAKSTVTSPTLFNTNSSFITPTASPFNWFQVLDNKLWAGTAGENNPCPSGFRLPTAGEWEQERRTWSSQNSFGAFSSVLKLPLVGYRDNFNGIVGLTGSVGYYWSSTPGEFGSVGVVALLITTNTLIGAQFRSTGAAVRCIQD